MSGLNAVRNALAPAMGATWLVSLDPGVRSPAAALWRRGTEPGWRLQVVARVLRDTRGEDPLQRCISVAYDLVALLPSWVHHLQGVLVSEWPEVRAAGRSLNSAQQLLFMPAVSASVATRLGVPSERVFGLTPTDWVGSLPKVVTGDPRSVVRGARTWDLLTDTERSQLPAQHDCFDATGIGLVATGRANRGLTAPKVRRRS